VSVILKVGPVTWGTVTRVDRTASSRPVHRTVRAGAVPVDLVAAGDEAFSGPLAAGVFDPEQPVRTALQRTATATRIVSVAILDAF